MEKSKISAKGIREGGGGNSVEPSFWGVGIVSDLAGLLPRHPDLLRKGPILTSELDRF